MRRPLRPWVTTFVFASLLLAWSSTATALDETTRSLLRQMSADGVAAYQAEDYATAVDKLNRAWGILQTAPLGLWSGRALEKSGRLVEASERYLAAERAATDPGGDKKAQEQARSDAQAAYQAIKPRIPTLAVRIEGAEPGDIELRVAGRTILADFIGQPVPVDPGQIEVVATRGDQEEKATVTLSEGERQDVTLTFDSALGSDDVPAASTATPATSADAHDAGHASGGGSWQRIVGWTGVGLGGAGLVLGGVTGGIVLSQWSALDCAHVSQMCNATDEQAADLNTLRMVSTVGFIAGGVLAATGVTLLLTAPSKERGVAVRPYFTGDSVGVVGAF